MRGVLCFGPQPRAQGDLHEPAALVPDLGPEPAPADAVAAVLARYLHAFGPSTPERFANWLAAPVAWARDVFSHRPSNRSRSTARLRG